MLFNFLLTLAVTGAIVLVAGQTCYHPDQTSSSSDEACGFSTSYCCEPEDTCVTQGLCQDRNNHLNGALTFFEGATEPGNYTRLYKTASCTNENWSNCINHCHSSDNNRTAYIWACNDQLSLFCCHDDEADLSQGDCCNGPTWSVSEAPLALNVSLRAATSSSKTTSSTTTQLFQIASSVTTQFSSSASAVSVITIYTVPASTTNTTSISPTSVSTSTSPATPSHNTEGLSRSAKIGLGVGITVGLVSIIALAFFWYKRRLSKRRDTRIYVDQPERRVIDSYTLSKPSEMESQEVRELDADWKPIELASGRNVAHELST
ncbi:hypothetical protein D6D02_01039 [Aureobasidium pullulans]|nr:hypothetical protein D6D02_01039 [Aureobasidium pullulans]